jgi:hypothetical protein
MAVRSVRPQLGRDKEGNFNEAATQDTIEIYAFFESPDGFFGLTSYLAYTQHQLRKSYEWIEASRRTQGISLTFPWRHVDTSHIETKGFLSQTFEFTIDQAKILDLLTGHTLYNDANVVLRELAQNAIDAVRLQCQMDGKPPEQNGKVAIFWDSTERILTLEDNGTGMSQQIIENHLLKVGSSRYQDPEFKKKHPDFSSIKRFVIPNRKLAGFLLSIHRVFLDNPIPAKRRILFDLVRTFEQSINSREGNRTIKRLFEDKGNELEALLPLELCLDALKSTKAKEFNTDAWNRKGTDDNDDGS